MKGSYWTETAPDTAFAPLPGDLAVDVAVVGAGIAGLTAAALLKNAGRKVAVVEAQQVGRQATGRSTAKLTAQHAVIYAQIERSHGKDGARAYAEANQAAVGRVAAFVRELEIDCDFEQKSAYVYTRSADRVDLLEEEAACAAGLGLPAELVQDVPLPFPVAAAVRFTGQAQFHPCKYLAGLARHVHGNGSHVFEHTLATDVEAGAVPRVVTERGVVTAQDVIVASHLPMTNRGMFFAKAYPHAEPILAARIEPSRAPEGMFISADTPILSVLRAPTSGAPYLIAAGGLYKPGHADDEEAAFATLERNVRDHFGVGDIEYRWTNHDYWPMDRVPFVGRASSGEEHLLVATGFHAWGLSNGTAAGMILADALTGRQNPWAALFDATRKKPLVSAPAFVGENLQVAGEMLRGHLARRPKSAQELRPGEAAVLKIEGERVAAYRDDAGVLHRVSAVCTHMKCVVGWNPVDRTWDCPCHGSRFAVDGAVVHGPAVRPLARKDGA